MQGYAYGTTEDLAHLLKVYSAAIESGMIIMHALELKNVGGDLYQVISNWSYRDESYRDTTAGSDSATPTNT